MKKTLTVNNHVYEVGDKRIKDVFNLVVEDCKKKKINMIYAIRKGLNTNMVKLIYTDNTAMDLDMKKFQKDGFKVFRCNFGE